MTNNRKPVKIVITGPENSGKTELAKALAGFLDWPMVDEMARYVLEGKQDYDENDLREICRIQLEEEKKKERLAGEGLICDTNALTIFIWAWLKLGVMDICNQRDFIQPNLYILCYPDVPYEYDKLREDTGRTNMLFDLYLLTLLQFKLPFVIVRGSVENRVRYTIQQIRAL